MIAVLLFAKAPRPGLVKTRLAGEVGVERAVSAYRAVAARVVAQVAAAYRLTVWYDPPDALEEMRAWLGQLEYHPQPEGDLGVRLRHAFQFHFDRGDGPVVAIGADAPDVGAAAIARAERALAAADVVLGPALDGGYYLLGLGHHAPQLFEGVPWGTSDVLQITLRACRRWHYQVVQLESLRDLDAAADLVAFGLDRT